jgi:alpha-beta hydrolase superfamily lysophospholipase
LTSSIEELEVDKDLVLHTRHWRRKDPRAAILIVHGAADHSDRWVHVGDFLQASGFDVHAYDMRGHGRSGGHPMYVDSFTDFLDDLELMMSAVRHPDLPMVVYGHSLGGLVATAYGVSDRPQPDLFVLSAPALGSTTPKVLRAVAVALSPAAPKLALPTVIKTEYLSKDPEVGEAYASDPNVHMKGTLRMGRVVFQTMAETKRRLGRLTTPALVIHGADDHLVPPKESAPLAAVPVVERKVFAGLRHEMHNEPEAEEVLGFVVEWIDGQLVAEA